ncbi:MAG: hypothetical protein R3B54_12300 [Bdellovibrionota bacterium]
MSSSLAKEHTQLILDGTKIAWHAERVKAWERGERVAPITIDMALTRACNFGCHYCYAMMQENDRVPIRRENMFHFLEDCAALDVKGISPCQTGRARFRLSLWTAFSGVRNWAFPWPSGPTLTF